MRKLSAIVLIMFILCGCFSRVSSKPVSYDSLDAAIEFYDLELDVNLDDTLSSGIKNVIYSVERNLSGQSVECIEFMHDDAVYHIYFSVSLDVRDMLNIKDNINYTTHDSFVANNYQYMILSCEKHTCVLQGEDNAKTTRLFDELYHDDEDISIASYPGDYADAVSGFIPISYENARAIYQDSAFTGVLYIGRESCDYCKALVGVLADASNNIGYTVLYLDTEKAKDAVAFDGFDFIVDQNGNTLSLVPSVMVFVNGAVVDSHVGVVDDYSPDEELSKEQYNQLYELFSSYNSYFAQSK